MTVFLVCAAVGLAVVALWTMHEARAERTDDEWFYE